MKKLLFLFVLLQSIYSHATYVQINFIDNFYISINNQYLLSPSEGTETTDSDINIIFSNYNINHCVDSFSYPNNVIFADYNGNNIDGLLSDLRNNINVKRVSIGADINYHAWTDQLYVKLIDNTIGNPIGTNSNGNIITTNTSLNLIFDTYQVKSMERLSPNLSIYGIYFEGNINNLLNELKNLSEVVENAQPIGIVMLLSTQSFNNKNISVSPNPFTSTFTIDTKESISNYSIFDISGKQIIKTNSKTELDNQVLNFTSGMYILKLESENKKVFSQKLIKQ